METENVLDIVYDQLDFKSGKLLDTDDQCLRKIRRDDWLDKGEWLIAAKRAGAEKIFFVDNNPVVVFAKCKNSEEIKIDCYNKLWSLARPRILFLDCEGELSVIDLAQKPIHNDNKKCQQKLNTLEILSEIRDVAKKLQSYHRNNIESGKVFEYGRFGDLKYRADQSLISDLRTVRNELINAGLDNDKLKYAHALIGRSIFIRYLEDRGILDEDYFRKVARQKSGWTELINTPSWREDLDFSDINAIYPRVLQNKEFTYALFKTLSRDFNGDMFPDVKIEEQYIKIEHLRLIQDLLYGDVGIQQNLFFFSYKFDIIPLDLISAIYEEFYHSTSDDNKKSKARQNGVYYTPPVLAEFVLSRVLTAEELKKNPRVLDPACGSGIFLVEAFRRMVRYRWQQNIVPLGFNELKEILGAQIAGIEVNEEAARITAFSLYLAMLNYLAPPSIQQHIRNGNKLPNLLALGENGKNHYNSIHPVNTFNISKEVLRDIDIIVGNPPWGAPGKKADPETKERQKTMIEWCKSNKYPIGNNEPSQAFLWRVLDFLKKDGHCSLLTSAGVLFKHSSTTLAFRKKWMSKVCLKEVFNFTHVRKFFFEGAVSPFVMLHFKNAKQDKRPVEYWSAKQIISLKETQAILFSKYDRTYLTEQDLTDNKIWKINWFGRQADTAFFKHLNHSKKLVEYIDRQSSGQGFKLSPPQKDVPEFKSFEQLNLSTFSKYDPIETTNDTPSAVYRKGCISSYTGNRILVKRGISNLGEIICRHEERNFIFSSAIVGLKTKLDSTFTNKIILGILWSSLAKYFYFNISSSWGLWHDEIDLDNELLKLPVVLNKQNLTSKHVISIVDKLCDYHPEKLSTTNPFGISEEEIDAQRQEWEKELDEAVFDLYELNEEQRDLIRDCCEINIPFFYQPYDSISVMPAFENKNMSWIQNYAEIFSKRWKPYLNEDEVLRADVHIGASGNMIALEFYPADIGDAWDLAPKNNTWDYVLEEIGTALQRPMGTSQIVLDGVVHAVSDNAIIIIKRNEKRFWTRSLAREDAASTLCKRMLETMPQLGGVE